MKFSFLFWVPADGALLLLLLNGELWTVGLVFCANCGYWKFAQLQKVFLPPGTGFLRRNFPNIDDEFS